MTALSILIAALFIGMSIGSVVAIIAAVILSGRVSQEERDSGILIDERPKVTQTIFRACFVDTFRWKPAYVKDVYSGRGVIRRFWWLNFMLLLRRGQPPVWPL